jgi:hypothetical protein
MTEPKTEPVRVAFPARTPAAPVRLVPPKITPSAAEDCATKPKNETARISALTPPLSFRVAEGAQPVPVLVTSSPADAFDAIPPSFRWGLFGFASLNFLIQIWIYVVS